MSEPTVVRYEPRGAAAQLFRTRESEVLLDGPAGTGKSLAALYRLHLAALKHPRIRCLIARKTAVSLGSTTLVTFDEQVAAAALEERVVRWYGGSPKEAAAYRYTNGSKIVVGGFDNATKIMSSEYDLIFVDEGIELVVDDWEAALSRLRHGRLPWQQAIIAANPAHKKHWLNQRANGAGMVRLISRHRDNPAYVNADGSYTERGKAYFDILGKLTGVRKLRLLDGKWASAEGVIYDGWDDGVHLVDRFPVPDHWQRFWSVDFGYTHPFVLQCWAEDGDGRLWLYREIFHTGRLVEDHARQILELVTEPVPGVEQRDKETVLQAVSAGRRRWTEPRPRAIVCDHDAEGRATLEKHLGMSTTKAHKAVTEGIQAVQSRLKVAGDGKPRLFILRDSVVERDPELVNAKRAACTAEELPGYVWAVRPGGVLKEEPVKEQDDGADCLRYMTAERDLGKTPRMRWLQ